MRKIEFNLTTKSLIDTLKLVRFKHEKLYFEVKGTDTQIILLEMIDDEDSAVISCELSE